MQVACLRVGAKAVQPAGGGDVEDHGGGVGLVGGHQHGPAVGREVAGADRPGRAHAQWPAVVHEHGQGGGEGIDDGAHTLIGAGVLGVGVGAVVGVSGHHDAEAVARPGRLGRGGDIDGLGGGGGASGEHGGGSSFSWGFVRRLGHVSR